MRTRPWLTGGLLPATVTLSVGVSVTLAPAMSPSTTWPRLNVVPSSALKTSAPLTRSPSVRKSRSRPSRRLPVLAGVPVQLVTVIGDPAAGERSVTTVLSVSKSISVNDT